MKYVLLLSSLVLFTSCLKKIEAVEEANDNMFDQDYAGEQWWFYDNVTLFTDSNNDQKVKIELSVPQENAPDLNPPQIRYKAILNESVELIGNFSIEQSGDYREEIIINPLSTPNYCVDLGVYVPEDSLTINNFTECKSL